MAEGQVIHKRARKRLLKLRCPNCKDWVFRRQLIGTDVKCQNCGHIWAPTFNRKEKVEGK